ncbi:MAG: glycosyltransferase [Flavobacteriales bacterium]
MRNAGYNSILIVWKGVADEKNGIVHFASGLNSFQRLLLYFKTTLVKGSNYLRVLFRERPEELFSSPFSGIDVLMHPLIRKADFIHLHWVSGFVDLPLFFKSVNSDVIWTMHDAYPFLGGLHYPSQLSSHYGKLEQHFLELKRSLYAIKPIVFVSPSKYLLEILGGENNSKENVVVIPNLFETSPYSEIITRIRSNESRSLKIVFIADNFNYPRKGYPILIELATIMDKNLYQFIAIGESIHDQTNSNINFVGFLPENEVLACLSEADVLIIPSVFDNLPNVALESFAVGTPVICFSQNGMAEHILAGDLGVVVPIEEGASGMAQALLRLEKGQFDRMQIIKYFNQHFSPGVVIPLYNDIWKRDLEHWDEIRNQANE